MSFDRLAPVYRAMEWILAGEKLQRCRLAHLAGTRTARRALLLGEGPGRFLVPLLQSNPSVQITCVDASAKMLAEAGLALRRARLDETRVRFIHADIFSWRPEAAGYDLISTHFFLDCFTELQLDALIPKLATLAQPDATWLVSDFRIPPHGFFRLRARAIVWLMYRFFRTVTRLPGSNLIDCTAHLQAAGFNLMTRTTHNHGLLHSDCWQKASSTTAEKS